MNSNRVWAPSNTGTKYHAFMGSIGAKDGNFRAACRVSTQRKKTAHYIGRDQIAPWDSVCAPCERAFRAAEDRAETSMMPATEARDLGYVAPVDERTEAAPQPATEPTPVPEQYPDLSTEDGMVKLANGDELTRRGHWADVWLKDGRTYAVSMLVHRKGREGASIVLVDHVIYWTETYTRGRTGPVRIASADDKPRSVGGRIWRLLLAANIA